MGANWNYHQIAIKAQLDSCNYCNLAHLFSFLGIEEQSAVVLNNEIVPLFNLLHSFRTAPPRAILVDFRFTRSMRKRYTHAQTPLDRTFSTTGGVARSQTKICISTTKRRISLRLGCLALMQGRAYQPYIHQTQFSSHTEGFPISDHYSTVSP